MRCLITNEPWEGSGPYSPEGLRRLDRRLEKLAPLPYTRAQLIEEAAAHAVKMSIQGMQPKVSTVLRVNQGRMEIVDSASVRSCSRNRFTAGMGRSSAGGRGAVALVGDLYRASQVLSHRRPMEGEAPAEPKPESPARLGGSLALHAMCKD